MKSISAKSLHDKLRRGEDIQLIDVRELWEREMFSLGGDSIPLQTIFQQIHLIQRDKPVVFYCEKGIRSQIAIQRLSAKYDFKNLINLEGGVSAWKQLGFEGE